MRRMRWEVDGVGLELDAEAPVTIEGTARAVPSDPLPLGISCGIQITRPKQLDFMHRFKALPLVPSYVGDVANGGQGLLFHHAHTLHAPSPRELACYTVTSVLVQAPQCCNPLSDHRWNTVVGVPGSCRKNPPPESHRPKTL
ncbi:hypothetical protein J5N97_014305 [Dioscorea zingiberensis]|uniref:Uncharacterized protein n=1 Tax=Dioscorea zingiberensis TaxID=325984 RepID=A0A9D5CS79_9LILI|nr:hypothetical protein J5N97_014305 [Dioscorea zingiberensis]